MSAAAPPTRARSSGRTVTRVFPVTPGGTTLRGSNEKGARGDRARDPADRPPRRADARRGDRPGVAQRQRRARRSSSRPSSPATATTCSSAPTGSCGRTPTTGSRWPAAGAPAAPTAPSTTRSGYETEPARSQACRSRSAGARCGALELSRLALPLPALLPSVNQIGFDSYDLIAGTLAKQKTGSKQARHPALGGRRRGAKQDGAKVADPDGGFAFPLYGTYRRDQIALNASQVNLQFSFGSVPLRSFDFRGATRADGSFRPGASLYGQVSCADVPNYSAQLRIAGVCNEHRHPGLLRDLPRRRLRARRRQPEAARSEREGRWS